MHPKSPRFLSLADYFDFARFCEEYGIRYTDNIDREISTAFNKALPDVQRLIESARSGDHAAGPSQQQIKDSELSEYEKILKYGRPPPCYLDRHITDVDIREFFLRPDKDPDYYVRSLSEDTVRRISVHPDFPLDLLTAHREADAFVVFSSKQIRPHNTGKASNEKEELVLQAWGALQRSTTPPQVDLFGVIPQSRTKQLSTAYKHLPVDPVTSRLITSAGKYPSHTGEGPDPYLYVPAFGKWRKVLRTVDQHSVAGFWFGNNSRWVAACPYHMFITTLHGPNAAFCDIP